MLSFTDICVQYHNAVVLKGVSGVLEPGNFTALIGPNGTGKSSLLKAIAGLVPSKGVVQLEDEKPLSVQEKSLSIAYMQQDIGPTSSLTVLEVVLLGRLNQLRFKIPSELYDEAYNMLVNFGVSTLAERTLSEISGGQRQLVYIAQAMFRKPNVLLLDEPTAALDLRHQLIVLDALKHYATQHNIIIMAAMHDLALCARFADTIICLSKGEIKSHGAPKNVLNANLIKTVYGVKANVFQNENGDMFIYPLAAIEEHQDV